MIYGSVCSGIESASVAWHPQGFPRGYTAITYRGKPAADGPRYKALGNSMAVNVMRWIGRRIEMVEAIAAAAQVAAQGEAA